MNSTEVSSTELLLREALTHLYLHRENQAHKPRPLLYAKLEAHLKGLRTAPLSAAECQHEVRVVYCKECGGAKYPWIEHHDEDCSQQHLSL